MPNLVTLYFEPNLACFSVFLIKPFVVSQILTNFVLKNGSVIFDRWKDPPVTPILYVRIFNLTNEEAFLSGEKHID